MRILLHDTCKKEQGLTFVVEEILWKTLKVQKEDVLGMLEFPKQGIYDIVLISEEICNLFWEKVGHCKNDPVWSGVNVLPHFPKKRQMMTVKMYILYVPEGEIMCMLSRYCEDVKPIGKVLNQYGLWTMKRRFLVDLKMDAKGDLMLPPARFKIGTVNGDLFFGRMPPFCRKFRRYSHETGDCLTVWCSSCEQEGHVAANCPGGKKFNLCRSTGHMHASCPEREKHKDQTQKGEEKKTEREKEREPEKEEELVVRRKEKESEIKRKEKELERKKKKFEIKRKEKELEEKNERFRDKEKSNKTNAREKSTKVLKEQK